MAQSNNFRQWSCPGCHVVGLALYDMSRVWETPAPFSHSIHGTLEHILSTIEYPVPLTFNKITDNYFKEACDVIVKGGAVISKGFKLRSPIRDPYGFCDPIALEGELYYRGYTTDLRPGILCQKPIDKSTPRGSKIVMPEGSYLVDADVFNSIMAGETIYTVLPSGA